jgi:hypothetical protein
VLDALARTAVTSDEAKSAGPGRTGDGSGPSGEDVIAGAVRDLRCVAEIGRFKIVRPDGG